ncbi:galactosylgalactosylxylosylprotein 3-beta-glucuronosyltransferase 2-like isoform X2 [Actinia tenebrosa]|uniref:Galactosylgalactosylxylosylprotein 3-beta-glucuronosyltransferase n=1 Tax=Actinia tenebrosa TaxID=6105 RepID=A0A6P8ISM1_ACTTE|nr:galactosylgalactosylxylosylprotein 3-beta-glucuronosyltransferase 2-like isoform X2 [Actinia tenebrosa]
MFVRGIFKYVILLCGFTIVVLLTRIIENRIENENFTVFSLSEEDEYLSKTTHPNTERSNQDIKTHNKNTKTNINILHAHQINKRNTISSSRSTDLPTIYAITPTYKRFLQKAELTRVANTFRHVKNFHWIVVEDSRIKTNLVHNFLENCGLKYTHLNIRTPKPLRRSRKQPRWSTSRGVEQRNLGLAWIRIHVSLNKTKGVVYFADDDNTYDVRLFEEMRFIKRVGIWPVAFTGAARWSGPVCKNGKVIGFHNNWKPWRSFPIDMAGFAINVKLLIKVFPNASFDPEVRPGLMETSFLEQITTVGELEGKADDCMKVYVWHTRTETPVININGERQLIKLGVPSNLLVET